jgi:diguanylate cyclase (GGDEF)-like protein
VIARLGGDEFAVFAADVNGGPEQLRKRLDRALAERAATGPVSLSVSVGVGSFAPDPGLQLNALLAAADDDMYEEKTRRTGTGPA